MARFAVLACIALVVGGCAPEALEGFDGDVGNNGNNGASNNGTASGSNNMTPGGQPSAAFLAVANIMTAQCGAPSCHGAGATNQFLMAAGTQATPEEVFAALSVTDVTVDGQMLIVAADSASSNIYTRMIHMDPIKLMPPGVASTQPDIDAVKNWLDGGASFSE